MIMRIYRNFLKPFLDHPLNRRNKIAALARFAKWQYKLRVISPNEIVVPFIGNSYYIVKKGRTGLTGNLYSGLHEFEGMMFLLHFLRDDDVFFDVGANVGSYSILSTGYKNAYSFSFEPVPSTFKLLSKNRSINTHAEKWMIENCAVGDNEGTLLFSTDKDTMNRVVSNEYQGKKMEVPVITLDSYSKEKNLVPVLMKIDAEGFDINVLKGATNVLSNTRLKAIIIEEGESGVSELLNAYGFKKYSYDPFNRRLDEDCIRNSNHFFLRDLDFCYERLTTAPKVKVLAHHI